ncbi:PAS domain S-box-containing protein [Nannocystis exedens]|uniref:histidine kinase n=1 Tax=Nannocystis exedens TaxID=54 RepID=A0A1I2DB88_9BACT|nr:ATP-binding protein [Nannocystis exedens]PCC70610.1 PAS domain-containing sensor histidine kinase [Nannocystis exedens]SFE77822.1 PAS domain S-box-containing protein [Nannocystis exedens]
MTPPDTHTRAPRAASTSAVPHLGRLELDPRLVVRSFDAGFAALAGERADEVLGRPLDALFSVRDRRGILRFDELISHSNADHIDLDIHLRLGARELLTRLLLTRTDTGWLAFIEDLGGAGNLVSELAQSRELWREVVHQSAEGVAVLGGDGKLLEHNPAFFRLLDLRSTRNIPLSEEAVRGAALVDLLIDDSLSPLRDHLAGRAPLGRELQHRGRWLEFAARPLALPRQRFAGVWLSLRDITERRRAERLRAALDLAREELLRKEKLAALGGLVDGIAHEIGNPLGVAVTAANLAHDQLHELRASFEAGILRQRDMRHHLQQALAAADIALVNLRRAAALVAGVKQIAVDSSEKVRQDMSVGTYVGAVVASLSPLTSGTPHRVGVDVRADPVVSVFPAALAQIVTNLVHNALTHAFPAGRPGRVVVWVDRVAGEQVEIGCRDDGVGMTAGTLPRIFEPFFTTARDQGSGLGLYIVHNLVTDLLRGTIVARAAPERGATFIVRFPARPGDL